MNQLCGWHNQQVDMFALSLSNRHDGGEKLLFMLAKHFVFIELMRPRRATHQFDSGNNNILLRRIG
jgi:hypothetical protein